MKVIKEFECEDCGIYEKYVKHTVRKSKCPTCQKSCESLISLPAVSKMADPRTVGSLLDKNNKKNPLSREKSVGSENDEKRKQDKHIRDINRMTPAQKQHYIMTGKKP